MCFEWAILCKKIKYVKVQLYLEKVGLLKTVHKLMTKISWHFSTINGPLI